MVFSMPGSRKFLHPVGMEPGTVSVEWLTWVGCTVEQAKALLGDHALCNKQVVAVTDFDVNDCFLAVYLHDFNHYIVTGRRWAIRCRVCGTVVGKHAIRVSMPNEQEHEARPVCSGCAEDLRGKG
jgi:hypothetical protein